MKHKPLGLNIITMSQSASVENYKVGINYSIYLMCVFFLVAVNALLMHTMNSLSSAVALFKQPIVFVSGFILSLFV